MKESIRHYVLDQSLPESRRTEAGNTVGYITNVLRKWKTLITTKGVLPRPNPGISSSDKRGSMRFIRANVHKLILREDALSGRTAKGFEEEYKWKFGGIPMSIQYADTAIYGRCLAKFVIQQLLSKQLKSLWLTLAFITANVTATVSLRIVEEHRTDLAKVKEMEHLDLVLSSMIEAADYTIAMALYLRFTLSLSVFCPLSVLTVH